MRRKRLLSPQAPGGISEIVSVIRRRWRNEFGPETRVAHHGDYLLFCKIIDGVARVPPLLRGARDIAKLLKDDPA